MTNISAITDGYVYNYNYDIPSGSGSEGLWRLEIFTNDTQGFKGTNLTNFDVKNDVTNIPTLTSTINSTVIPENHTFLNFSATDPDYDDNVIYYVYGDTNSDPSTLIFNGTAVDFNWTGLTDNQYYWKEQAGDSVDNFSFSNILTL